MRQPAIAALLGQVDHDLLRQTIFHLAEDPLPYRKANFTRPGRTKSTLDETDDYLEAGLSAWGWSVGRTEHRGQAYRLDPLRPRHHLYALPRPDDSWYTLHNLNARRPGAKHREETICVVAHKDSASWTNSPGAHDNAAGTACALEIARVLANYESRRSLWFLFCNEEHTPMTSIAEALAAKGRNDNLIAVWNLDVVSGKSQAARDAGRKTNVTLSTTPEGERLAHLMAEVNETYGLGLEQSGSRDEHPAGDDGSFINAGFPTAVTNLGSCPYADPNYHEAWDIPELVDVENVRMTTQATLAAILTLDQR